MANKRFLPLFMAALSLFFILSACDSGSSDSGENESSLNGTYKGTNPDGEAWGTTKLSNGEYEYTDNNGRLTEKGTYAFSNNIISFTQTHSYGTSFYDLPVKSPPFDQNKLYTLNELKALTVLDDDQFATYLSTKPWVFTPYQARYDPKEKKYIFDNGYEYIKQ